MDSMKDYFSMFSDTQVVCDHCQLKLPDKLDQYLGNHKSCIGLPEDELQRLKLLKKRMIELVFSSLELELPENVEEVVLYTELFFTVIKIIQW